MDTGLKEAEWFLKKKILCAILTSNLAHKKRLEIFVDWPLPISRVSHLFQILSLPFSLHSTILGMFHWFATFPPIILHMLLFFFLPGTAFPPTSVMLSCNIHHSCNFVLICDHHVLVCQPLDKKLYKRRKWFVFAHQHSWVSGCLSITRVCLFNIFSSCMIKGSVPYYRS